MQKPCQNGLFCFNLFILLQIIALVIISALPGTEMAVVIFYIPIAIYGIYFAYSEIYGQNR